MRRTTQWAVFTSMNQQQPARRSLYDASDGADRPDTAADAAAAGAVQAQAEPRTAPDARRDRVDFM